jgi:hypothetical protein
MKAWTERPLEEANLLNPAFCCVNLTTAIVAYLDEKKQGLPLTLAFIVLPVVLHKATRELLPGNTRMPMALWIQENPSARILFHERVLALRPYTREAMLFGAFYGWLTVEDNARLQTSMSQATVRRFMHNSQDEARECVMRSRLIGKWFAIAGTPQTVMALWGIRP